MAIAASILSTCDDPSNEETFDQTWQVRYFVSNQSSVDLILSWGTEFFYASPVPIEVPAGTKKEIAHYDEFLGPDPDAGRTFTCVSAHRSVDSVLVYQQTPVRNSRWTRHEPVRFKPDFTLELTDAKLQMGGLQNSCGQLTGTAIDSLTGASLNYVYAVFHDDSLACCLRQTNSILQGTFSMTWSGDIPPGEIRVSSQHYFARTFHFPEDVDTLGDRYYRLKAELTLSPLP